VLVLMAVGLAVGLMPLAWYLIEQVFFAPEVEYNGVYEPLPGVDMITSRQDSLDSPFEFRLGLLPFLGAGLGAAVGFALGRQGLRLVRSAEPGPITPPR